LPRWAYDRPVGDYDPDFDRAKQDRLAAGSRGGLVSLAYWIARGVSALVGLVLRRRPSA